MTAFAEGLAQFRAGRLAAAAAAFEDAARAEPDRGEARFLLGRCRFLLRDFPAAAAAFRAALARDAGNADILVHLGVALYELEALEEAEACFRRAVALKPEEAAGWNNLAALLLEQGDPDAAAAHYRQAYERRSIYPEAYSNRLMCEQFRPGVTAERLARLSAGWAAHAGLGAAPSLPAAPRQGPLVIGFVSPDLRRAPVGYFLAGLVAALDPGAVRAILYSDAAEPDDLSQRLARSAAAWRETRGLDHRRLHDLVRQDGVEILFDLAGHTKDNRLPLFARRAAPVQVSWAGYAGTTGVRAMDYLLADRHQVPPGEERCYSETVLRMPQGYVCYAPPDYAPAAAPLPAQGGRPVTFAAFHNAAKCGAASLPLWAAALAAVPDARLVLKYKKLDQPANLRRIRDGLAAHGLAPDRVIVEGTSPHLAMLERYNSVDIALDALPYSGGLTTCEALWMGVPVVTLPGASFAGRHSQSHLASVGLTELIARDAADYVRIAAELAADLPRLATLRQSLRARMTASPLCDAPAFARDFTALMQRIAIRPG